MSDVSIEQLIVQLTDADNNVRCAAVAELGNRHDPRAVEPLISILAQDTDEDVRSTAASRLSDLGDLRAVEPLIVALDDASAEVRGSAAMSLGDLGDPRAVDPLIARIKIEQIDYVLPSMIRALGEIEDPRALPVLRAILEENVSKRTCTLSETAALWFFKEDMESVDLSVQALVYAKKEEDWDCTMHAWTALHARGFTDDQVKEMAGITNSNVG